jgi:hypothetical protein
MFVGTYVTILVSRAVPRPAKIMPRTPDEKLTAKIVVAMSSE